MYIVATGMACPVGLSAASACAAMRARIAQFHELPFLTRTGEPAVGAAVLDFVPGLPHDDRLLDMLAAALDDCLGKVPGRVAENVPLLLGLAEPQRGGHETQGAVRLRADVEGRLGARFHPELSREFRQGHTAGFHALRHARQLLPDSGVPACLVCAVDSYLDPNCLQWLEKNWRLKRSDHADGVIPGEAAAAVWVQPTRGDGAGPHVRVAGLGQATETATVLAEEPLLGLGLAEAARAALVEADLQMHQIGFRLSDVTGESYGFKEQALAMARLLRVRHESLPIWHCADAIGDTGAAAGVCQLVVAFEALRKGYAPADRALCCTSAVHGDRVVAVLQREAV